jgi:hypothetical protein
MRQARTKVHLRQSPRPGGPRGSGIAARGASGEPLILVAAPAAMDFRPL